jgi:iron(III) transport system substrate-binding protein
LELNGNAAVKDAVAEGVCDLGFTDTDDFFDARDDGKTVAVEPVRLADKRTIVIPNTVAIIRGTRRENEGRRLVDFLLSEETELALSRSKIATDPTWASASGSTSPQRFANSRMGEGRHRSQASQSSARGLS